LFTKQTDERCGVSQTQNNIYKSRIGREEKDFYRNQKQNIYGKRLALFDIEILPIFNPNVKYQ